ncbi:MAG: TetR/AcrR family transcriptional regulator [Pseudomonadaceae bacterium]|nr:TetR/AcrR family transcriptional regulator [Pseudomonadaceae bacterium]
MLTTQESGFISASTTSTDTAAKDGDRYHHGDLRMTLMDLAIAHIEKVGMEKLSLRALAREAGVSATAPYRHFPSRQCLLAGIAIRGFRRLKSRIEVALTNSEGFEDQFVSMGLAYIDNAVNDPVTYQLMFGAMVDFSAYPDLQRASEESFGVLLAQLKNAEPRADLDLSDIELAGTVWSGVHGIASLTINGRAREKKDAQRVESAAGMAISSVAQDPERVIRSTLLTLFAAHS